jgi:hypothetical protein
MRGLWRRLREYDLTPIGAVIVVALLGAGVVVLIFVSGGSGGDEAAVRAYYRDAGAPADLVERIEVAECALHNADRSGRPVYRCAIAIDAESHAPCFVFDEEDRIVAGGRELAAIYGCDVLRVVAGRLVKGG